MNFLFANTTNHRRIVMSVTAGTFGIFTALFFYQLPLSELSILEPLNTALVGLLIFESLLRAKRWLNLKTLPVFAILVTLICQWLYSTLYAIEYGGSISFWEPFRFLFSTFPYNLHFVIESFAVTGFAYYLVIYYRKDGWVIFIEQEKDSKKRVRDLAVGFFGWFLFGNLFTAFSIIYSADLGVLAIFFILTVIMIGYLLTQNRKWIGIGIVAAVITNAGLWVSMIGLVNWYLIIPLPLGNFHLWQ